MFKKEIGNLPWSCHIVFVLLDPNHLTAYQAVFAPPSRPHPDAMAIIDAAVDARRFKDDFAEIGRSMKLCCIYERKVGGRSLPSHGPKILEYRDRV